MNMTKEQEGTNDVNPKWAEAFAKTFAETLGNKLGSAKVIEHPERQPGPTDTELDYAKFEKLVGQDFFRKLPDGSPDKRHGLRVLSCHPQFLGNSAGGVAFRTRF